MVTYPNQKIIHINKQESNNFLQVDKSAWVKASEVLTYNSFKIYLYLAGNQDGFDLALSQRAVFNTLGISKASYHRSIKELEEKGFIVLNQGNIYDFFTGSLIDETGSLMDETINGEVVSSVRLSSLMDETRESHVRDQVVSCMSREIDKRDKRDNIDNIDRGSLRKLSSMETFELQELLMDFNSGVPEAELYNKYSLTQGQIDSNLPTRIEIISFTRKERPTTPLRGLEIPLADGSPSNYWTSEFVFTPDNIGMYYESMERLFNFDMKFVIQWFANEYGYTHESSN